MVFIIQNPYIEGRARLRYLTNQLIRPQYAALLSAAYWGVMFLFKIIRLTIFCLMIYLVQSKSKLLPRY
jgi:hypothetical protein